MKSLIIAWLSVILLIATWGLFGYGAVRISNERFLYATEKVNTENAEEEDRMHNRIRTLLRDTQRERAALETFTTVDVVTAAGLIEQAGKAAGVQVQIEGAAATPTTDPAITVRSVVMNIRFEGTLSSVTSFLTLLEKAPFASFIESVDMRPGDTGVNRWEGTTHIKIITTSKLGV